MEKVYGKSPSIKASSSGFCPGCLHGVATKLVADAIDKYELRDNIVGVMPVGCGTLCIYYFNFDRISAAHGRAPAVGTAIKRSNPDQFVLLYQGDGDLASIGIAEAIHCANRGENVTTIFVNNGIYGMTGGQMAPTTLVGQKATTAPFGRDPKEVGYPIRMAEMIATLEAPAYVARFALHTPAHILKAKKGIEKAFELQINKKGYSFIELLSNCPTNWGVSPEESVKWIEEKTIPYFPLGEFKTPEGGK